MHEHRTTLENRLNSRRLCFLQPVSGADQLVVPGAGTGPRVFLGPFDQFLSLLTSFRPPPTQLGCNLLQPWPASAEMRQRQVTGYQAGRAAV